MRLSPNAMSKNGYASKPGSRIFGVRVGQLRVVLLAALLLVVVRWGLVRVLL